jgi:hypothetical protein
LSWQRRGEDTAPYRLACRQSRAFRVACFFAITLAFVFQARSAESIQSRYNEPYPAAASKKGLQVEIVEDALALGVKHAALNFNVSQLIDPKSDTNNPSWQMDAQTYRFKRGYVEQMDRQIKALSDRGVLVNLIVLAYQSNDPEVNRLMLHPNYSTNAPNRLGAFNTVTADGQRWFTATMEFIAERWSRPDRKFGRVVGYIMGNEVNSHWWWSHMGRVTMREFAGRLSSHSSSRAHSDSEAVQLGEGLSFARTSLEHSIPRW